jgi:ribose 5-phosphate isomerase A
MTIRESAEDWKRAAAAAAMAHVRPGLALGLGTGSTARHFVDLLGAEVARGLDVLCVPTSEATRVQAEALRIPLTTLDETPALDLTVDGADEIAPGLALIKGGGAALLREKIVAAASAEMIVIADASKLVSTLGAFPLPIEVVPFGLGATRAAILAAARRHGLAGDVEVRRDHTGATIWTDGGHLILDGRFGSIPDPRAFAAALSAIPGVVEHGLFLGLATRAYLAGPGGARAIGPTDPFTIAA